MQIEKVILSNLINNEDFSRRVLPYIKVEYFQDRVDQAIFTTIYQYINKYRRSPSKEAVLIDIDKTNINDEEKSSATEIIQSLNYDPLTSIDWLINSCEAFCQDKAMFLALTQAIQIHEGKDKKLGKGSIPSILKDALAVSFDSHIGHDYFDDAEARYKWYHLVEHKVPFEIDILNKITRGGISKKSLTILMAGINVGKTAMMCGLAAACLRQGKNVLYITLEMSEEMISSRIDANLMDLTMDEVPELEEDAFLKRIALIRKLTPGALKVKEFATGKGSVNHFEHLLYELELKQNYKPDIIFIDYLNNCASTRFKAGTALYEYIKAVGEEIRGMAVEQNVPIVTATQFNREGFRSSDPGLDNVAESFGTGATADLVLAILRNEEMDKLNQLMMIQLKNRYSDKKFDHRFIIGVDMSKMRFYDIDAPRENFSGNEQDEEKEIEDLFASQEKSKMKMSNDAFKDFV